MKRLQENINHNIKVTTINGHHLAGHTGSIQLDIELGTEDIHHQLKLYAIDYPIFDAELNLCADIIESLGELASDFFNC